MTRRLGSRDPSESEFEFEFDQGTVVRAHEQDPGVQDLQARSPQTYDAELGSGWQVGAGINGGLLLATAANALAHTFAAEGHRDPFSISGYYLSASRPGAATLRTEVIRRRRNMSTGGVSLFQTEPDGTEVERLRALATYGDLASRPDEVHTSARPPDIPPLGECVAPTAAPPGFTVRPVLLDRFDLRLDPETLGWMRGTPSGRGVIRGWIRMADGREPDPLMLLLVVDALPPVTFDLGLPGWAPTLELTAHVRADLAPGWL